MLNMNLQFFAHKKGVGSKKSRRTVCKSWKHFIQTAWNKDSSGR